MNQESQYGILNGAIFLLLILVTITSSCTHDDKLSVETLTTVAARDSFLVELYRIDQGVRKNESKVLQAFGKESKEYKKAFKEWIDADKKNFELIEKYLDLYGYPEKNSYTRSAFESPFFILQHSSSDNRLRRKFFPMMYKSYESGDLDIDMLNFFLARWHDFEKGYRISWDRPYTSEMELDSLMGSLGLSK